MSTLFDLQQYDRPTSEDFTTDDWETPPEIARKIAALIKPLDLVLDPCAGRGAMVRYIKAQRITALEIKPDRVEDGKNLAPNATWRCTDFLKNVPVPMRSVVVTNPPFSLAIEFIERSLLWLDPRDPDARLLFLLPGDYFASQERNDRFEALNCCISHRYRIRGRVGYIKEGVQMDQRQVYDCVYEIRPGKDRASETVL